MGAPGLKGQYQSRSFRRVHNIYVLRYVRTYRRLLVELSSPEIIPLVPIPTYCLRWLSHGADVSGELLSKRVWGCMGRDWNLNDLEFRHTDNRIKIQLSTIGYSTATAYNYQYKLVGIDKEWKNLRNTREINLALNPGSYTLEIASGRFFNKRAYLLL